MTTRDPRFGLGRAVAWCMRTVCTISSRESARYAMTTYVTPMALSLIVCGTLPSSMAFSGAEARFVSIAAYTGMGPRPEENRHDVAYASVDVEGAKGAESEVHRAASSAQPTAGATMIGPINPGGTR